MLREAYTPYCVWGRLSGWFDHTKRMAFISAMMIGFLTHFLLLVYMFMSPDGLVSAILSSAGNYEASLGRWGLDFVDSMRADRSVSAVSAVAGILLASVATVFIVDLFEMKYTISAVLTAAAVMVSPALTITLLYEYCSDAYMLSFFFAVLAVFCIYRMKRKIPAVLFSSIFIMCSMALYQSYLGVFVGLCIMLSVLGFLKPEKPDKAVLRQIFLGGGAALTGIIFYYLSTRIACWIRDIAPSSYSGANEISLVSVISSLGTTLVDTYKQFLSYFLSDHIVFNQAWHRDKMFMVLLVIAVLIGCVIIWKNQIYKKPFQLIAVIICIVLLPLGLNIIFIAAPGGKFYALTSMQVMLLFPFLFALLENDALQKNVLLSWCGILISITIFATYYMADVFSYTYLKMSYDQGVAVSNRILERMEITEGYEQDMPCMIAGILSDENFKRDAAYQAYTLNDIVTGPIFHSSYAGGQECWRKFMLLYLGEDLHFCEPLKYLEVVSSDEFKNMNIYPNENSVQIIDGVMVVKMTDNPPIP